MPKKGKITLLSRKLGWIWSCTRWAPQEGQVDLFLRCVLMHLKQKVWPQGVANASSMVSTQMGHARSSGWNRAAAVPVGAAAPPLAAGPPLMCVCWWGCQLLLLLLRESGAGFNHMLEIRSLH